MTATPRQLSDAISADYDEIVAGRPQESQALASWTMTCTIAGWVVLGSIIAQVALLVPAVVTGSMLLLTLFVLTLFASPLLVVPAIVLWLVALVISTRLAEKRREAMFTRYAITVDRTVSPPVFSVTVPPNWLRPELHCTRALLADSAAA